MASSWTFKNALGKNGILTYGDTFNSDLTVDIGNIVTRDINGNVGIGTTNPVTKLTINHSANAGEVVRIGNSAGGSGSIQGSTYIGLNHWGTSDTSFSSALIGVIEDGTSSYNASLIFSTRGSGTDTLATERMRIDSAGNLNVGISGASYNAFYKNGGGTAGTGVIFLIANAGADSVVNVMNATSMGLSNSAGTAIRVAVSGTTNRSINAAGTINASGADYAEYEYSNDINLVKGQIVGFKVDGTLTDKYSESIRFAIKSTNPSIVGGDAWGTEEIVGKRPEQPVKTEEITDEEFAKLEEQYKVDLADFESRLEVERQKVDRIAYAGKVPVNVYGAVAGQYVIVIEKEDGTIDGKLVNKVDMTFSEYQDAVGRVNKILDDGRAEVAVIIH